MLTMREREQAAIQAATLNKRVNSMNALAIEMKWSSTMAQRVCHSSPKLMAIINFNKKPKKIYTQSCREPNPDAKLIPVIQQLRDAVNSSGLTHKEILERAGMSQQFFRDVFKYGHLPRLDSLLAVCQVVGLEPQLVRVVK